MNLLNVLREDLEKAQLIKVFNSVLGLTGVSRAILSSS